MKYALIIDDSQVKSVTLHDSVRKAEEAAYHFFLDTYIAGQLGKSIEPPELEYLVNYFDGEITYEIISTFATKQMSNFDIWFSVVEWPDGSFGDERNTEVSHFATKVLCETSLKEYLEDIFEMKFETLEAAFREAVLRGFKVWYTKAEVRDV